MSNRSFINRFAALEIIRIARALEDGKLAGWGDVWNAVRALTLGNKYEYVITDGGRPEGQGWEHSPHSKNPNSYRRKVGPHHDVPKTVSESQKPKRNYVPFNGDRLSSKMRGMMNKALDFDIDYFEELRKSKDVMDNIHDVVGTDYMDTSTAEEMADFADNHYGKDSGTRQWLSSLACKIMGVKPDGYCIKEPYGISEEEEKDARIFIEASQMIAKMTGLVDKDGYVTAYRGTNGQLDENGKYHGSNCESWTVNPSHVFPERQIIKAKIPVERIIGCFAGNPDIYSCMEDEITCCTSDLDLKCEDLLGGANDKQVAEDYDFSMESFEATERVNENLRELLKEK